MEGKQETLGTSVAFPCHLYHIFISLVEAFFILGWINSLLIIVAFSPG